MRRLHSDQGGEFKSYSLEEFCHWKGIVHTFTNRAQHESNELVERKIGQLNESTRAALLASDLPAYLWPEVYMAMCHTQNIVPSSALQRELKKKEQQKKKEEKSSGEGNSAPGETREATATAEPVEQPVRNMIPSAEGVLHGTRVRTQHGQSVPGDGWVESSEAVQTCSRTTSICTTACHAHAPAPSACAT